MTTMLCRCHKTYERVADKAINQLICSKIGKRLLLQWKLEKAAQWYGALFAMT
jgi:hypothetical protein